MRPDGLGGSGKLVESNETYFGEKDGVNKRTKRGKSGFSASVRFGLIERGGKGRMIHVHQVSATKVANLVRRNH